VQEQKETVWRSTRPATPLSAAMRFISAATLASMTVVVAVLEAVSMVKWINDQEHSAAFADLHSGVPKTPVTCNSDT
jgi:hypothetical protein